MRAVKVTARLASELSGNAPQLDGLLVKVRSLMHPSAGAHERYDEAPPMNLLPPIPIHREMVNGWWVHRVSSPILAPVESDRHQRIAQHFPRGLSLLLAKGERGVIATTNGQHKSQWLPVRRRLVERIVWFAVVHDSPAVLRRELKRSLTDVDLNCLINGAIHVGAHRKLGSGRVAEWTVEAIDEDYSWFAPHPDGTVLMRQLPYGEWLPKDLIGFTRDYGSVTPPYWHPGRNVVDMVTPC